MNKKRGELTSTQLIGLILAIAGFVIVLILLASLEFGSYSQDEVCKLSVLTRATSPNTLNKLVPLKCQTEKICLSGKLFGGRCEQFVGEGNVRNVDLKGSTDADKANVIAGETANAMYSCWNMMGQGKLDLFSGVENPGDPIEQIASTLNLGSARTSCVICSRIAIDNSVDKNEFERISKLIDVNDYLASHTVPTGEGLTYLQALTDRQVNSYPASFKQEFELPKDADTSKKKPTDEVAIVFMQIMTAKDPGKAFGETALKGGAFVFATGAGVLGPLGFIKVVAGNVAASIGAVGAILGVGGWAAYTQYQNQQISAAYCGPFAGEQGNAHHGCSLVVAVDYKNISQTNKLCGRIEGEP